jgi:hypothetical protein
MEINPPKYPASCVNYSSLTSAILMSFQECSRNFSDYPSITEQLWENEAQTLTSFLNHLKVLKIHLHFSLCESVIIAARFLLKHGNALQELTLTSNHHNGVGKAESIFGFPRGSPHVKISID